MKKFFVFSVMAVMALFCGCHSTYPVDRNNTPETSVVFTRPARFTPFFGSYSLSEFVEITYERASRNHANQFVVEVGIRNRGPVSWTNWFKNAPEQIPLKVQTSFFRGPRSGSPSVYTTNRQEIVIGRGETYHLKVVCPVKDVSDYQVVLGD